MCFQQTFNVLTKHCPNKLNQVPCTIFYTAKMKTFTKGTTVDKTNLKPGELVQMDFSSTMLLPSMDSLPCSLLYMKIL